MAWHDYLALAVVFGAAAYVVMRAYKSLVRRSAGNCHVGCGSCGSQSRSAPQIRSLISIGPEAPAQAHSIDRT